MQTNLLKLRKEKNVSQGDVAKFLGTSRQVVSRYERGDTEANYETLCRLSQYFDVSVDYLLGNSTFYYPDRVASQLSEMEKQLITYFRRLPGQTQNYVFGIVQNLAAQG